LPLLRSLRLSSRPSLWIWTEIDDGVEIGIGVAQCDLRHVLERASYRGHLLPRLLLALLPSLHLPLLHSLLLHSLLASLPSLRLPSPALL